MADETKKTVQLLGKRLGPMLSVVTKPFVFDIQERFKLGWGVESIGGLVAEMPTRRLGLRRQSRSRSTCTWPFSA